MRYDTPIYFQRVKTGEYNQFTGDYEEDTIEETTRYASVMDTKTETMKLIYGVIRQGSLTLTIQNHYEGVIDYIRVGNIQYRVDYSRKLKTKQSFIVTEVQ